MCHHATRANSPSANAAAEARCGRAPFSTAIAHVAGGDWPRRIRNAALALWGAIASDEVEDSGVCILRWFKVYFDEMGNDRFGSKALCKWLNDRPDAGFKDWREGRGIDERSLSRKLQPFEIQSSNIAIGHERPKGYLREWFKDLWEAHLPQENDSSERYPATSPANISENDDSASVTRSSGGESEKCISTNEHAQSSGVADDKPENEETLLI